MKFYLRLFLLCSTCLSQAQVVFCPPGAKWTANFYGGMWNPYVYNESITYVRDSIEGQDTLKVLQHNKMYYSCNGGGNMLTAIRQKGDTIWFKNKYTSHQWQVLINYACVAGQSWTTTVAASGASAIQSVVYTVDSVKFITENGLPLKQLYLKQQYNTSLNYVPSAVCSERYAWGFLFRFPGKLSACDGDGFLESLCYSDQQFGTKYFGTKRCDNANLLGMAELQMNRAGSVYPVPCNDKLSVEDCTSLIAPVVLNSSGIEIKRCRVSNEQIIDVSDLPDGVYFLRIENEMPLKRFVILR